MDQERRNRVAALLATTDHLPRAVMHEVLDAHDALVNENLRLQAQVIDLQQNLVLAGVQIAAHSNDAARLADWIIRHPQRGPEMNEVLNLHDRIA